VDATGNVYVSGESTATWGVAPKRGYSSLSDAFVAKLNAGGVLQLNTFLGGGGFDGGDGIAADAAGNVYVSGRSNATWGAAPVRPFSGAGVPGAGDAFVARIADPSPTPSSPPPPALAVVGVNGLFFTTGGSLSLTGAVTPGSLTGTAVDAFIAITLPDGQTFYLQPDGTWSLTAAPVVTGWPLAPVSGTILDYTFQGTEPPGVYILRIFFRQPGGTTPVGREARRFFIFIP